MPLFILMYLLHPDLFHLSSLLSPPPPGVACFPQCMYPCVSCLPVPVYVSLCFLSPCASVFIPVFLVSLCQFVLYVSKSTSGLPPFSWFLHSPFSSHPDFDPCLFLDFVSTCLIILPSLTTILSATLYLLDSDLVLTFFPVHDHSLAYPFGLINIVRLQPSASCVCIWVSPCALIYCLTQKKFIQLFHSGRFIWTWFIRTSTSRS